MKSPFFNTEIINTVTLFFLSFLHSFFKRKWNKLFFFKNIFYQLIAIQFQCSAIRNFSFQFGMKKYTFQTIFKCFYKYFPSLFIQNTIVYLFSKCFSTCSLLLLTKSKIVLKTITGLNTSLKSRLNENLPSDGSCKKLILWSKCVW